MLGIIPVAEVSLRGDLQVHQEANLYLAPEVQDFNPVAKTLELHLHGREAVWIDLLLKLWRCEPWPVKVFNMDDWEWWAGESLEACKAAYLGNIEGDAEELAEIREMLESAEEVPAERMDSLQYRTGEYHPETGEEIVRSFRAELARNIADGIEFPCPFASTEG